MSDLVPRPTGPVTSRVLDDAWLEASDLRISRMVDAVVAHDTSKAKAADDAAFFNEVETSMSSKKNDYLGEELVTDLTGTDYEGFTPTQWALEFIGRYGQIDGDHHKTWVLDQVARILCGTPVIVEKASWGKDSANVRLIEHRINTAEEPSAKYVAWVAGQEPGAEKMPHLDGFTSLAELAALEFIATNGVHEQPDLYTKSKEENHAVCMRLHALAQHKLWMLDQVARILLGTPVVMTIKTGAPSTEYHAWVEEGKGEVDENGETEYGYEEGEPLPEAKRGAPAPYCAGIAP